MDVMAEGWLERVAAEVTGADLHAPGLDGEVAVVVPASAGRPRRGAPAGDADHVALELVGGRVAGAWAGAPGREPLVTFTLPRPDLVEAVSEGVEPSVLYMQGRLKVDGDPGAALAILAATATAGFRSAVARLGGTSVAP